MTNRPLLSPESDRMSPLTNCGAGIISLPRQHASCSSKVISASAAIANLFHRARMPWILEHPCDSWWWDVPKIPDLCRAASHGLGPREFWCFWITCRKRTLFLVGNEDSRDSHRIVRKCVGTCGRCSVPGQEHVHPKASASRSEFYSSRDHLPSPSIFRTCYISHHERTTIPKNTPFHVEWEIIHSNASKDIGMGVAVLALTCDGRSVYSGGLGSHWSST